MNREITAAMLSDARVMQDFIDEQVAAIQEAVGNDGLAVNALSGGVDSSVVTMLGHRALGSRLKTYFIDSGLMREGEPGQIFGIFWSLGIPVEIVNAADVFLRNLAGLTDPEKKRDGVSQSFYRDVFGKLVRESGAQVLLHGTNLTDVEETKAGIKRQHNIFEQLGIDPQQAFGYKILEPLVQLRKDGIRLVAQALDLPPKIVNRQPFPGPGLSVRIQGEVTAEKLGIVRKATVIVEEIFHILPVFQTMTILKGDRVTGIVGGKRLFGYQIEVRAWTSVDARKAEPAIPPTFILQDLGRRIPAEVPGVVSVVYQLTPKPPCTMEAE
ncbi:MAG: ExsB family transcriptional regulator [Patescibacteria group bacterium]|nr:ExsB family transcriptional regulator [Patescibacteria group bacterium]